MEMEDKSTWTSYSCRAEVKGDIPRVKKALASLYKKYHTLPTEAGDWTFLSPSSLSKLIEVIVNVRNAHVMAETIEKTEDYTGERNFERTMRWNSYTCRAELDDDIQKARKLMIRRSIKYVSIIVEDQNWTFESPHPLEELLEVLNDVPNGEMMAETFEKTEDFTGVRNPGRIVPSYTVRAVRDFDIKKAKSIMQRRNIKYTNMTEDKLIWTFKSSHPLDTLMSAMKSVTNGDMMVKTLARTEDFTGEYKPEHIDQIIRIKKPKKIEGIVSEQKPEQTDELIRIIKPRKPALPIAQYRCTQDGRIVLS